MQESTLDEQMTEEIWSRRWLLLRTRPTPQVPCDPKAQRHPRHSQRRPAEMDLPLNAILT